MNYFSSLSIRYPQINLKTSQIPEIQWVQSEVIKVGNFFGVDSSLFNKLFYLNVNQFHQSLLLILLTDQEPHVCQVCAIAQTKEQGDYLFLQPCLQLKYFESKLKSISQRITSLANFWMVESPVDPCPLLLLKDWIVFLLVTNQSNLLSKVYINSNVTRFTFSFLQILKEDAPEEPLNPRNVFHLIGVINFQGEFKNTSARRTQKNPQIISFDPAMPLQASYKGALRNRKKLFVSPPPATK